MRITDLLKSDSIVLGASPADKAAAINQLADLMEAGGNLSDKEQYKKDVFAREASGTTGLRFLPVWILNPWMACRAACSS